MTWVAPAIVIGALSSRLFASDYAARGAVAYSADGAWQNPIFMPFTSWLILGPQDVPTPRGLAGIVLVVVGAYLLNAPEMKDGLLAPFRAILRERGSAMMLVVAFCWSFTSNRDKAALGHSSGPTYFLLLHAAFTVIFGATLIPVWERAGPELRRFWPRLFVVGLLSATTLAFQAVALVRTRAPYVIAVKRSGLLGSIAFGCLVLKEGRLRDRLPGGALMAAGAAIVLVSG